MITPSMLKKGFLHPCKTIKYLKPRIIKKFRINYNKPPKPHKNSINYYERSVFSQNGEDGIIEYIFSVIGTTNKFFVEFGADNGKICNTRYLQEKKGWNGLLMDPRDDNPISIKKEFVTAENVNDLFEKYNVPKNFDLLSIDVNGNDYHIWKAIKNYTPRVVVIEYNAQIPPHESRTIEYEPNFIWDGTDYFGASLLALVKLGKSKGYTLVGCDNDGVNAFFIKNEFLNDKITIKCIDELYRFPQFGKFIDGIYRGHPKSSRKMLEV